MNWIPTTEKTHPDKPGLARYEQIPCLVVYHGEICIRQWNCEHLVWDEEDGDDFCCKADEVTHWMPLPPMPNDKAEARYPVASRAWFAAYLSYSISRFNWFARF